MLPDRMAFLRGTAVAVEFAKQANRPFLVLVLDIKKFHRFNHAFGYELADEILTEVGTRLKNCLNSKSRVTRIGDNKFGIIIPEIPGAALVPLMVDNIVANVGQPFELQDKPVNIECRVGGCIYPDHAVNVDGVINEAEQSLLIAKTENQKFRLPVLAEGGSTAELWDLEEKLVQAIDQDEFTLHYHPQVDLHSFRPAGAEALLRWNSESLGPVSPGKFIPVAEKLPVIHDITDWVIKSAIREMSMMPAELGSLSTALNISAECIGGNDISGVIDSHLLIWGVNPENLTIEITETSLMENPEEGIAYLENLRAKGVQVSIDDFGTGYSSLAYFKTIPADEIKIDQVFVSNMLNDKDDARIVATIIDLAKRFGKKVVAEGVENRETLQALVELDCDYAQGFYFTKPLPFAEYSDWLLNYRTPDYF